MPANVGRSSRKAGLPPGTLVYLGPERTEEVRLTLIDYDSREFTEKPISVDECATYKKKATVTWINVDGLHNADTLHQLGAIFDLHPLLMEDIMNTGERPKVEDFEKYLFIVIKMLHYDREKHHIESEHVSLVLGPDFVLSFQERPGDVFESIRDRIRQNKGRIRQLGADYLVYALMDAIVDTYFSILEDVGDRIEALEDMVVESSVRNAVRVGHQLRRQIMTLRRSTWPLRETIGFLLRGESPLLRKTSYLYFRDLYDHTIQIIETIESFRDMLASVHEMHLSVVGNRANEIMKVLTTFAAIFIPLTFIVGVYGMNFDYMPELRWRYGYALVWGVMLALIGAMLVYFRRKKWI